MQETAKKLLAQEVQSEPRSGHLDSMKLFSATASKNYYNIVVIGGAPLDKLPTFKFQMFERMSECEAIS